MFLPTGADLLILDGFGQLRASNSSGPAEIRKLAVEFESLLIHEMLKSFRASFAGGWLDVGEEDEAGDLMVEAAEQQLARALAAAGGLGLAKLVEEAVAQENRRAGEKEARAGGSGSPSAQP